MLKIAQCHSPAMRHEVWGLDGFVGSAVRLHHVVFECRVVGYACSASLDGESGRRDFMCRVMYSAIRMCSVPALTGDALSCG